MKKVTTFVLLIFVLVLAACGSDEPEETAVSATEAPAVEEVATEVPVATEAPAVEEAATEAPAVEEPALLIDPELVGKTWAWERRDSNGNASDPINVPNSENYTLVFGEDGTFAAKMDCNNAAGDYTSSGIGNIMMTLGPSTMAFCGEESLDTMMSQTFGPAQNYTIEGDGSILKFIWVAGGPIDYYRNVTTVELDPPAEGAATGTVTAADGVFLRTGPGTDYPYIGAAAFGASGEIIGVSQDGLWYLVDAPSLPEGEVWVVAEFVEATNTENIPVVASSALEASLTNIPWTWVSTTNPATGEQKIENHANYIVLFNDDGTANIKVDCNNSLADYTTDGSNITITPGPSTMVACENPELDTMFLTQLSSAAIYFIEGGNLYLDLPMDSGTMRFIPEGVITPPTEDTPAGEADSSALYLASYGAVGTPQPLIEGSQITAHFAGDQISGNASCNNYSGTMAPVNDYFNVTGIVTTRQFCDGLMDQENAYLAALGAITGYQWTEQLIGSDTVVTSGEIFYTMPDGAAGVLNYTSSQ